MGCERCYTHLGRLENRTSELETESRGAACYEPLQALLELQEKDMTSALRILTTSPEMPAWESSGRVALIGDAVHVMPPTGGVGANTALKDAAALSADLPQGVSKGSVTWYDEDMRARVTEAILGSARDGKHLTGMRDWRTFEVIDV